jgi:hypothetical protein
MKIESIIEDGSWSYANSICSGLGRCNNLLTQATKIIERLPADSAEASDTGAFIMRALLSSHDIRAKFLYAMLTVSPGLEESGGFTDKDIYEKFNLQEISAICAAIFAYHLIKKIAPSEYLPEIEKNIQEYGEVGMLCGRALSKIGLAKGVLIGSLRSVAFAAMAKKNPKGYGQYKSHLKKTGLSIDLACELEIFHCQHPQVVSLVAQKFGFPRRFAQDLYLAFALNIKSVARDALHLRMLLEIIDSVMLDKAIPGSEEWEGAVMGVDHSQLGELLKPAKRVKNVGSLHAWMSRGARDITPNNSPDLFKEKENAHGDMEHFDFGVIPEAVRQEFSYEDFISLRHDIKKIVDQK